MKVEAPADGWLSAGGVCAVDVCMASDKAWRQGRGARAGAGNQAGSRP